MPRPLPRSFYARPAETVARDLLGRTLVRRTAQGLLRARIVETEAYVGPHDLACHASKGLTKRTAIMFGEAGHAYVYLIYGMHHMLNVVTGSVGEGQAVLVRAAEPLDDPTARLDGPGKLCAALAITRSDDGADLLRGALTIVPGSPTVRIATTPRIGIDYAGEWRDAPLRFLDEDSDHVSRAPGEKRRRR